MPKLTQESSYWLAVYSHRCLRFFGAVFLALTWLALSAAQAQTTNYTLGTAALLIGPAAGTNSVVLGVTPGDGVWTATTNATWLHLNAANQTGTGGTNVIFSYDSNPGPTRSGTLSIAGQTVTVTQAASTYVAAGTVTTLVASGLDFPFGVAVDGAGNVYFADSGHNAIKEWVAASNTVISLVSSGLYSPWGVAVDSQGNVYFADSGNNAIKEWKVADSNVTTLVSSGLLHPQGLALDAAGNVYFADTLNNAIKEWKVANSNVSAVISSGLDNPYGVAVDGAANIYVANTFYNSIVERTTSHETLALASGLSAPYAVALDGAGNVYFVQDGGTMGERSAANQDVFILASFGTTLPMGVAADGAGNIYVADSDHNAIKELPHAFVDTTPKLESLAGGNDVLPVVLPSTANLLPPFAPFSDQPWLTITGTTNGIVSFAFTASTSNRTATITLLGQNIFVTQGGPNYSLGTTALVEGPSAGLDSVVLAVLPLASSWTNQANASWLHLSQPNQSGTGSTNVIFSFDANPGATRSGGLTISGQTVTVTQAGSTYVPVGTLTTLVPSGVDLDAGLGVDGAGNVYFAGTNNAIQEWSVSNNTFTTLVSSDVLSNTTALTVDSEGDVYVAVGGFGASIDELMPGGSNLTTLFSLPSNFAPPNELALDSVGNVYVAIEFGLVKWTAAGNSLSQLVPYTPKNVAVDIAGNVYYTTIQSYSNLYEVMAEDNATVELPVPSAGAAFNLAVDGSGSVYFTGLEEPIEKWSVADNTLTTLVSAEVFSTAVDRAGNVYCLLFDSLAELPHAFIDPTPKLEGLAAGSDVLPAVVPATANLLPPFAPTSDQSWLTITGITNGAVSFSFTANTGPARTANISLLGQTIPVTQGTVGTPPMLTGVQMLGGNILQFGFSNTQTASLTVLATTNLSLPLSNWTVVGMASNTGPGQFQFTSQPTTNDSQLFYVVRSP